MDDFLFLVGSKVAQKYPDKENSDSQEYSEADYVLEFWRQGN
jgi:hypothetical protein